MSVPVLGKSTAGAPISIDIERLISTRMLITATSGAGKSWALRRILEQTHGRAQQIVLDPEGEFYSLREKHELVLAGKGGDCPAEPRSAALLARRLLELGTSAVIDLYELDPHARARFVRLFVEALVEAPRELWHPALVVIDEAHAFAPEKSHGEAESTNAIASLMSKGRKRGFCGILATQRISKLSKDVAAEAGNLLIGRASLDVDVKRVAAVLGLTARDASERLPHLADGHFFAFGPALSAQVVELKVGDVATSHPKSGQRAAPPAPPRGRVREVLGQLADLPAEAEAEARTIAEARAKVRELERELAAAKRAQPEAKVERVEVPVLTDADRELLDLIRTHLSLVEKNHRDALSSVAERFVELNKSVEQRVPVPKYARGGIVPAGKVAFIREPHANVLPARNGHAAPVAARTNAAQSEGLNGPEQRILDALAWWESVGVERPSRVQVAVIARYSPSGGAFQNPLGALRTKGFVEYPSSGAVELTSEGRARANAPGEPATSEELHERLRGILNGPQWRILEPLLASYPEPMSRADLAAAAVYEPNGGAFQNPLGLLRSLGLIDYPESGKVVALPVLFLESAARR